MSVQLHGICLGKLYLFHFLFRLKRKPREVVPDFFSKLIVLGLLHSVRELVVWLSLLISSSILACRLLQIRLFFIRCFHTELYIPAEWEENLTQR